MDMKLMNIFSDLDIKEIYDLLLGPSSNLKGPILSVVTIITLVIIQKLSTRALKKYMRARAQDEESIAQNIATWKYIWTGVIAIFAIVSLSGSLKVLGISAGFLGLVLGWSLQAPVTGIAAWLMLIVKRPFKVGDRVIIAGYVGDITDITLTHVILNQVGGTVGGEERSGRGILIPNAILFSQVIVNYTLEEEFILDEVPVRITFNSDWQEAERILLKAAKEVTANIIEQTGENPFIRAELFDAGVLIRLRYKTRPEERQRISSEIVKIVFEEFKKSDRVEFCYAHSEVIYSWKGALTPPAVSAEKKTFRAAS
jgi:small-conductance mechanosensitive channel